MEQGVDKEEMASDLTTINYPGLAQEKEGLSLEHFTVLESYRVTQGLMETWAKKKELAFHANFRMSL